jgi:hypothetical protein
MPPITSNERASIRRLTLAYSLREALPLQVTQFTGQLPEPWTSCTWDRIVQRGESRQRPFALTVPFTLAPTSRIQAPPALVATILAAPGDDPDDFMAFHAAPPLRSTGAGAQSTAAFTIEQRGGTFAPARSGAWCDGADALGRRVQLHVTVAPPNPQ